MIESHYDSNERCQIIFLSYVLVNLLNVIYLSISGLSLIFCPFIFLLRSEGLVEQAKQWQRPTNTSTRGKYSLPAF